jgi:hypothetical protein
VSSVYWVKCAPLVPLSMDFEHDLLGESAHPHSGECTSSNTLQEINVSYCPMITDLGLGYLISKVGRQLRTIQVWSCAQLRDDFFDSHNHVRGHALGVVRAWMKMRDMRYLR